MNTNALKKLKSLIARSLWTPAQELPQADAEYAEWIKPSGRPVKNKTWRLYKDGRGAKPKALKRIDEFYHRGSYSRHEIAARHKPKAVMAFRGKGSKVERRSNRSISKRKKG